MKILQTVTVTCVPNQNVKWRRAGSSSQCRPAFPKILLSVLQTAYVRIVRFLTGFFADAPPISQDKTVSKVNFSIIQLVRTVWTHIFNYTDALHSDDYFVYIYESCSQSKTAEHFLQKQCTVCAAFADASFLKRLLSGWSLFPWFPAFFLLFVGFVQPLITDSFEFKPTMYKEDS